MTSSSRQFPPTRAGGKCNQVVFPTHSPATTTRSNRAFELSPRLRSSKIVMRKPLRRLQWLDIEFILRDVICVEQLSEVESVSLPISCHLSIRPCQCRVFNSCRRRHGPFRTVF